MTSSGFVVQQSESKTGRPLMGPNGRAILLKIHGSDVGQAYSLLQFTAAPHTAWVNPHIHHGCEETLFVLDGEMQVVIGKDQVSVPAGSCVLIPRGTPHSHSNPGDQEMKYLALFSPAGMEQYFEALDGLIRESPDGRPNIERVLELNATHGQERLDADGFFEATS
jgi:mannose-6-phosphate isomerase-like protein (cupin superfamily)